MYSSLSNDIKHEKLKSSRNFGPGWINHISRENLSRSFEWPYLRKILMGQHDHWITDLIISCSFEWCMISNNEKFENFLTQSQPRFKSGISQEPRGIEPNSTYHHSIPIHLCQMAWNLEGSKSWEFCPTFCSMWCPRRIFAPNLKNDIPRINHKLTVLLGSLIKLRPPFSYHIEFRKIEILKLFPLMDNIFFFSSISRTTFVSNQFEIFFKAGFWQIFSEGNSRFFAGVQIQQASTNWSWSEKLLGGKIFLKFGVCDVILFSRFWKLKKAGNFQERFREPRVRLPFTDHHSSHWSHIYRTASYLWNSKRNFFSLGLGSIQWRKISAAFNINISTISDGITLEVVSIFLSCILLSNEMDYRKKQKFLKLERIFFWSGS